MFNVQFHLRAVFYSIFVYSLAKYMPNWLLAVPVCSVLWMYRHVTLDYFDAEKHVKTPGFQTKFCIEKKHLFATAEQINRCLFMTSKLIPWKVTLELKIRVSRLTEL